MEERLDQDLKIALLASDHLSVSTLRGLKSVILYAKVAQGSRDTALPDEALVGLLQKEAKKRQESADLYLRGGSDEKAQAELAEKAIIERYLPEQLDEAEVAKLVEVAVSEAQASGPIAMGAVIAKVKQQSSGQADGALIARLVKERLAK